MIVNDSNSIPTDFSISDFISISDKIGKTKGEGSWLSEFDAVADDIRDSIEKFDSDSCHVVVNRVGAVTIRVPILVNTLPVKAVVDTGVEVTLLSDRVYQSISSDNRPPVQKANRRLVVAEADKHTSTSGMLTIDMTIGGHEFKWPVYVASIADDFLLGCDIIDEKEITINVKKGLEIDGSCVKCEVTRKGGSIAGVVLRRGITIPACSEFVITACAQGLHTDESRLEMLQPINQDGRKLIIARTLTQMNKKNVPVRLINYSHTPMRLKKGCKLGELQEIGDSDVDETTKIQINRVDSKTNINEKDKNVDSVHNNNTDKQVDNALGLLANNTVHSHLQYLYDTSCKELTDSKHKTELARILNKYAGAFAKDKSDLDNCTVLKHSINTMEAAPIRQHLRKTPKGFEGEDKKCLDEQLKAGIIVPSAWASPVVLVRKRDGTVRWCIDYKKLNNVTVKDAYPLPRIDMCLDSLGSAKYFSTFDLQSGYWQIELDDKDMSKTAFITKYGLFEYTKMPFVTRLVHFKDVWSWFSVVYNGKSCSYIWMI